MLLLKSFQCYNVPWISLNFCPLNFADRSKTLSRNIIVKLIMFECNNVTRVRVETK